MRKMNLADAFFLISESSRTPMHVGGLSLFTLPDGVEISPFLDGLVEGLHHEGETRRPFGEKLKLGLLGTVGTIQWQPEDMLDLDYHIRRAAFRGPVLAICESARSGECP